MISIFQMFGLILASVCLVVLVVSLFTDWACNKDSCYVMPGTNIVCLISFACGKDNVFTDYHTKGVFVRLDKKHGDKYKLTDTFKKTFTDNGYKY